MSHSIKRLIVLLVALIVYLCIGGLMFSHLEGDAEGIRIQELREDIKQFLENNSQVLDIQLYQLLVKVAAEKELISYVLEKNKTNHRWDFGGAFGFSVSVVTTIGYGNMSPRTIGGKIACVCYAIVGIPVIVLMLSRLGQHLAALSNRVNNLKLCSQKPLVNKVINMIIIIIMGLVLMFIAPAFIFHLVEGWGFTEALYFCFITLSTIGFGDYIIGIHEKRIAEGPGKDTYEIVAYIWILFGLAYLSLVIKYISDVLVQNATKVKKGTIRRFEGELGRLQEELKHNSVTTSLRSSTQRIIGSSTDHVDLTEVAKNVQLLSVNHI